MKILSVATATNHLSVAINEDQLVLVEKNDEDKRNHSEHLDPIIQELLKKQHLTLKDIDRFAVAIGPGSYTGLRIGITTVKMLASILQTACVGISTLKAIAVEQLQPACLTVAMLDARNDNYFAGAYTVSDGEIKTVLPDQHYSLKKLLLKLQGLAAGYQKIIFIGTGLNKQAAVIKQTLSGQQICLQETEILHAGNIGKLAVTAQSVDPDLLLPRYLRRTPAEMQWHQKTGKPFAPDSDYVEEV
jgi:tRNA threonylcarbamoyladenosine biosynthesis protein TsaB